METGRTSGTRAQSEQNNIHHLSLLSHTLLANTHTTLFCCVLSVFSLAFSIIYITSPVRHTGYIFNKNRVLDGLLRPPNIASSDPICLPIQPPPNRRHYPRDTTMEDSSEDVNEFLLRIRELGDKRVKEDEDRARKLEEEILQGRKERQARRAGKQYLPSRERKVPDSWAFAQVTIACPASSPFPSIYS